MIKTLFIVTLALSFFVCHASELEESSPPPPPASPFAPTPVPMDFSFETPTVEELGVNVPSNPTFFIRHADSNIPTELYRLELIAEAYFENHQYPYVMGISWALSQIEPQVCLRLVKKLVEKSVSMQGKSEEMPKCLHEIADLVRTDQNINSLIETEGLEPAIKSKLLSKLSTEGTLIRHVRDVNMQALEELVEMGDKAGQQDIDAAFEEAVHVYQKARSETGVDVALKGVILEWMAGKASEKARKRMHPQITSYTSFLIDRGVKNTK